MRWSYGHQDLGESPLPDGSRVLRPCVLIAAPGSANRYLGVVDSGSPLTVADPVFLRACGVDPDTATPVMRVPLHLGGRSGDVSLFRVPIVLVPPSAEESPVGWTALIGARDGGWRLPFGVLLGQRGWFDRFTTTIDATHTTVTVTPPR